MADGRRCCTKTLDQLIDEDSFPTLITMLDGGNRRSASRPCTLSRVIGAKTNLPS